MTERAADHAAIHEVAMALLTAVNAGDVAGILACWAADGVMMPPHHPAVFGQAAIADHFRGVFAARRLSFTFTASHIVSDGDMAIERLDYAVESTALDGGSVSTDAGKGLHVYARGREGWRLTHDIWNSDRPLPMREQAGSRPAAMSQESE